MRVNVEVRRFNRFGAIGILLKKLRGRVTLLEKCFRGHVRTIPGNIFEVCSLNGFRVIVMY